VYLAASVFYDSGAMRLDFLALSRRPWDALPRRARLQFLAAAFFTFSSVGFLLDLANPAPGRIGHVLFLVFMGGAIGIAYGLCLMLVPRLLALLVALHVVAAIVVPPHLGSFAVDWAQVASTAAGIDLIGCLLTIVLGYAFFIRFIRNEAQRHVRIQTEMELAHQIHNRLVSPVAVSTQRHEFYGLSVPSGEMGGDLVDLVQGRDQWVGYLADVSGHGVPSGITMAMVKSAARMRLRAPAAPHAFLEDVNQVIAESKAGESTFVTLALLTPGTADDFHFATAGHPPILLFRSSTGFVEELSTPNPALGIFETQRFISSRTECSSGDIAVLVTDGLTEVRDEREEEYGLERVKQLIAKHAARPLKVICEALLAEAREFGPQTDDQSVLLVRWRLS
jgi:serine phosphatase RsbU (regulator of sigma subunit)